MKRIVRLLTLATLLTGALALSAQEGKGGAEKACQPCKRSVCVQLCGSQQPAFCEQDPVTGCLYCACNG